MHYFIVLLFSILNILAIDSNIIVENETISSPEVKNITKIKNDCRSEYIFLTFNPRLKLISLSILFLYV